MYECMHACMFVCMNTYACTRVCVRCMYACTHTCLHGCMHVCIHESVSNYNFTYIETDELPPCCVHQALPSQPSSGEPLWKRCRRLCSWKAAQASQLIRSGPRRGLERSEFLPDAISGVSGSRNTNTEHLPELEPPPPEPHASRSRKLLSLRL